MALISLILRNIKPCPFSTPYPLIRLSRPMVHFSRSCRPQTMYLSSLFLLIFLSSLSQFSSAQAIPTTGWEQLNFKGKNIIKAGPNYIHIKSKDSASAYFYKFENPIAQPFKLAWEWKVTNIFPTNPSSKLMDDYPARVYVIFEQSWRTGFKIRALNYVITHESTEALEWRNPFSNDSIMFARNITRENTWEEQSARPMADYKRIFKRQNRAIGIAVMSDTDNTHREVEAWYRNIQIQLQP